MKYSTLKWLWLVFCLARLSASGAPNIVAWGYNAYGSISVPAGLTNAVAVDSDTSGYGHSIALRSDGTVTAWGENSSGQLNIPAGLSNALAVAAGIGGLAVRSNGTVVSWGTWSPAVPVDLSNVVTVAAGYDHSLAVRSDGTVAAWGNNGNGQSTVPAGLSNAVAVAAGSYFSLALRANGTVSAWGVNYKGECNVPVGLSNAVAIAAGGNHVLALRSDGTVIAWGDNYYGQCNVPGKSNAVAVAAGDRHSVAAYADGTVLAWGGNVGGQCNVPAGLSNAVAVSASAYHGAAVIGAGRPFLPLPVNQFRVNSGDRLFLSARPVGELPMGSLWLKDGIPVGGATNTILPLTVIGADAAGDYCCVVSNALGVTTGALIKVSVYFTLTVTGGTGSGSYTNGTLITITADTPPLGKTFDRWTGDTQCVADITSAVTTVTMPAQAAGLTAAYKESVYPLTVTGGTGGGLYTNGAVVNIAANPAAVGQVFDQWIGDTQYVASVTSSVTAVIMPAQNISVSASYRSAVYTTNLVEEGFGGSGGALPDSGRFEWGGDPVQTGSGQLNLSTDGPDQSWIRSKAAALPGTGQEMVLQMRLYAYAEDWNPGVYGDCQPRGLRVGTDPDNAVEFYSLSKTGIGLRVCRNGAESMLSYEFPAGVDSMHDYEISVTATAVCFKVDGVLAGTVTDNIPTGMLNVYVSTFDGGGVGNVPVSIDSLSLTLVGDGVWQKDSDGNGISDTWEELYFGSPTGVNPSAVCSNGINTVREAYIAGLNPTDPQSIFQTVLHPQTFGRVLNWNAVSGRVYSIYWTSNLLNGFRVLETNIMSGSYTDLTHTAGQDYYRIDVQLP